MVSRQRCCWTLLLVTCVVLAHTAASHAAARIQHGPKSAYLSLPLTFEANRGQTDRSVRFLSRTGGSTLFLTSTEAVLSLPSSPPATHSVSTRPLPHASTPPPSTLRMKLVGANPKPVIRGEEPMRGRVNYLRGRDPRRWERGVPLFGKVRYREVYPGTDLVYYGNNGRLEYDFIVAPGADPGRIRLRFDGARSIQVDDHGDLLLDTGSAQVRQHRPIVYQEIDGQRRPVAAEYAFPTLHAPRSTFHEVAFNLSAYDRSRPLIIDPVLVYSTYLGGEGDDFSYSIAVGNSGDIYVTGRTRSTAFPVSATARQKNLAGDTDVFITRLNPSAAGASGLVYSTYLGGTKDDGSAFSRMGIAVDGAGSAYVTGSTASTDFPVTPGAFDTTHDQFDDAYVAKLSPDGSQLQYCTFLGGNVWDYGHDIAVDSTGRAYVSGGTGSTNFPLVRAIQTTHAGGLTDVFVTVLNATGSGLFYSTYLGSDGNDDAFGITLDPANRVYITGTTFFGTANPFPTTANGFQRTRKGNADAFVARLDPALSGASALQYSSLLGGSDVENGYGIALDDLGDVYLTGQTMSSDFPLQGPIQNVKHGTWDAYVTKLTLGSASLTYSTYLGGFVGTIGYGIGVDANRSAYVTGPTGATDFPATDPLPGVPTTVSWDAFITKLNPAGTAHVYSTRFGGTGSDNFDNGGGDIVVDAGGNAYITGTTRSTDYPVTPGAFQTALANSSSGSADVFIAIIGGSPGTPLGAPSNLRATPVSTTQINLSWRDNSTSEGGFQLERTGPAGVTTFQLAANVTSYSDTGLSAGTHYSYRVRAFAGQQFSGYSNTAQASTFGAPPAAPSGLGATAVSATRVHLVWLDNSANEDTFEIERKIGAPGDPGNFALVAAVGAATSNPVEYDDTTVVAGTTYTYRVRAVNGGGASAYTDPAQVTTPAAGPGTPVLLLAQAVSATRVALSWRTAENTASYAVERSPGAGGAADTFSVPAQNVSTQSYSDMTARPNTRLTYRVQAVGGGGASPFSNALTVLTLPGAPQSLSGRAPASGQVELTWQDPTGADGYRIERRTGTSAFMQVGQVTQAGVRTFTDRGLAAGITVSYRVRGFNATGNSAYSSMATVRTSGGGGGGTPLVLTPTSIRGGGTVRGVFTLPGGARRTNAVVTLSSSNTRVAAPTVSSLTIRAGARAGQFSIRTTRPPSAQVTVTITATLDRTRYTATLTVTR